MRHAMCAKRQLLDKELDFARTKRVAFQKLTAGRQDLDSQEKTERDKVNSEYNLKVAEITKHDTEAPLTKCGCR